MWVYWWKLYKTPAQAKLIVKRMEDDWWIYDTKQPEKVKLFQTKSGNHGVKYIEGVE